MKDIHLSPDEFDFALRKSHVQSSGGTNQAGVKAVATSNWASDQMR